jgi:hypothetical protein
VSGMNFFVDTPADLDLQKTIPNATGENKVSQADNIDRAKL